MKIAITWTGISGTDGEPHKISPGWPLKVETFGSFLWRIEPVRG